MSIVKHEGSALAIDQQQSNFSETQVAALAQIGVDRASEGDLSVFFHVCQRSGLDPFARQIYMIGRESSERGPDGEWRKVVKQTIQTGIDGFRLIGRRAADRAKHAVAVSAPEWAHDDGTWRPVWRSAWGTPVAARVTIHRGGEPFTAVALFDEYKQTKRNGDLTQMWQQRPAGQIAKCAEALAWRMAFPQDLSGIYADEEMEQADNRRGGDTESTASSAAERMREVLRNAPSSPTAPQPGPGETGGECCASGQCEVCRPDLHREPEPAGVTSAQLKKMGAAMREVGLTERQPALDFVAGAIGREVSSRNDLTKDEATRVIDALERRLADRAAETDIVEGEIVADNQQLTDDPEKVWEQVLAAGRDQGLDVAGVRDDFSARMGGLLAADASAEELRHYLGLLQKGAAA